MTPGQWAIVQDILECHLPLSEVWAFGSRASSTHKPYSDLDLAVIGDQPLSLAVLAALNEAFSNSALPFKVDVVDWATTSESFRERIRTTRVVIRRARPATG